MTISLYIYWSRKNKEIFKKRKQKFYFITILLYFNFFKKKERYFIIKKVSDKGKTINLKVMKILKPFLIIKTLEHFIVDIFMQSFDTY